MLKRSALAFANCVRQHEFRNGSLTPLYTSVLGTNFIRCFSKEAQEVVPDSDYVKQLKQLSPTGKLLDLLHSNEEVATRSSDKLREDNSGKDIKDVIDIVLQAVDNVKPLMQVDSNKSGNKVMYIPRPLKPRNQTQFAIKWIIEAAIKRCMATQKPMHECLAVEILLAYQKKGNARLKRDELHKLAMDNRANIAVKWWE